MSNREGRIGERGFCLRRLRRCRLHAIGVLLDARGMGTLVLGHQQKQMRLQRAPPLSSESPRKTSGVLQRRRSSPRGCFKFLYQLGGDLEDVVGLEHTLPAGISELL